MLEVVGQKEKITTCSHNKMLIFPILVFGGSCLFCQLWVQVMSMSCPSVLGGVSQPPLGSWWLLRMVTSFKLSSMHDTEECSSGGTNNPPPPNLNQPHTPLILSNFLPFFPISTTTEQQLNSQRTKVWPPPLRTDPSDVWGFVLSKQKAEKREVT